MKKMITSFWKFCRPHTIFGSLFSVTTLYLLAIKNLAPFSANWSILITTLIASLACNIFIVGLNQIIDKDLDKINKPFLPLASGEMSVPTATKIIWISFLISILVGFYTSTVLGVLIFVISAIGYIYSAPPLQLKKHHLPAAISITLVRGLLVNIGMYIHFRVAIFQDAIFQKFPNFLLPLTLFIIAFSVAIAWFKDLPDTKGDSQFNFKTLSVLYSRKVALVGGCVIVIVAYLFCIVWSYMHKEILLFVTHSILLLLFIANIYTINLNMERSIKPFYMRFWLLFFLEYMLFGVWSVLK